MNFGIAVFPTSTSISMAELAREVEARNFESLWVAEHSHIPIDRQTPWPGGGDLPEYYWQTFDPFMALTIAASVTSRIKLGTGVCLVAQRDPIITAKSVATLDVLSAGRFLFGIGGGWNREEMANHGTRFESRWKLLRERIEAMKAIWTTDPSEYHGEFVDFPSIRCYPKPIQRPHPPILLGGNAPRSPERVVRYATGWMPSRGKIIERLPELERLATEAGREPIPVTTYPPEDESVIDRLVNAGIERCIFYVSPQSRDAAIRDLERLTRSLSKYMTKATTTANPEAR